MELRNELRFSPPWTSPAAGKPDREVRPVIRMERRRPPGLSPAQITTALWLKANDPSTISTATGVSQWRDKSGNNRHVTQATGAAQPFLLPNGLNGRTVLSFNGSQWFTSPAAISTWNFLHNNSGSSVFAVWKAGNISDPNALYALMGTNRASAGIGYYIGYDDRASASSNNRVQAALQAGGSIAVNNTTADNAHPANTPVILSHVTDPTNATAANRSLLRINGTLIQNNTSTIATSAANASFALQIGAAGNNLFPMIGYIAEIVALPYTASNALVQGMEDYLAIEWVL